MTEKELTTKFKNLLAKKFQEEKVLGFYYKIPDTKGLGGLRPFDAFLLIQGSFIAIEFKKDDRKLEKHQQYWMEYIKKCRGNTVVVTPDNYIKLIDRFVVGSRLVKNLLDKKKINFEDLKRRTKSEEKGGGNND